MGQLSSHRRALGSVRGAKNPPELQDKTPFIKFTLPHNRKGVGTQQDQLRVTGLLHETQCSRKVVLKGMAFCLVEEQEENGFRSRRFRFAHGSTFSIDGYHRGKFVAVEMQCVVIKDECTFTLIPKRQIDSSSHIFLLEHNPSSTSIIYHRKPYLRPCSFPHWCIASNPPCKTCSNPIS